jgi:anti-sigma B factor antagonist
MVMPQLEPNDQASVTLSQAGSTVVVHVAGEIDLATRDIVADALFAQLAERPAAVVIDLSAVGFMGSTGLGLLVEAMREAQRTGVDLQIIATTQPVLRSLQISGLDRVLPIQRAGAATH